MVYNWEGSFCSRLSDISISTLLVNLSLFVVVAEDGMNGSNNEEVPLLLSYPAPSDNLAIPMMELISANRATSGSPPSDSLSQSSGELAMEMTSPISTDQSDDSDVSPGHSDESGSTGSQPETDINSANQSESGTDFTNQPESGTDSINQSETGTDSTSQSEAGTDCTSQSEAGTDSTNQSESDINSTNQPESDTNFMHLPGQLEGHSTTSEPDSPTTGSPLVFYEPGLVSESLPSSAELESLVPVVEPQDALVSISHDEESSSLPQSNLLLDLNVLEPMAGYPSEGTTPISSPTSPVEYDASTLLAHSRNHWTNDTSAPLLDDPLHVVVVGAGSGLMQVDSTAPLSPLTSTSSDGSSDDQQGQSSNSDNTAYEEEE